jgi:predicted membrane channel-forming protein YqfA (hemolysin III family)
MIPKADKDPFKVAPRLFGMNAGSWHRLDNIYAILSVQSMFLYFADFKAATTNDAVRWLCLSLCLFFQELAPWNLLCTVLPILVAAFIMLSKYIFTQQLPAFDRMNLVLGSLACIIGIIFFQRGLNEDIDYLRFNHAIWHAMAGIATYFWYRCKVELDIRAAAKIM